MNSQDDRLRAELEQAYCQHRQALFSLALTVTGCSGLAEDAVHEAFVRLFQKDERPAGSLVAYVFAAVRNAAIDCLRRQQRHQALTQSVFADRVVPGASAESMEHATDQLDQLRHLIDALDEAARGIIVMKTFGDLTFDEIGEVLGTPAATVATRYRRLLSKLEEQLRRIP